MVVLAWTKTCGPILGGFILTHTHLGQGPFLGVRGPFEKPLAGVGPILWMDELLHHFEAMTNDCLLIFAWESTSNLYCWSILLLIYCLFAWVSERCEGISPPSTDSRVRGLCKPKELMATYQVAFAAPKKRETEKPSIGIDRYVCTYIHMYVYIYIYTYSHTFFPGSIAKGFFF